MPAHGTPRRFPCPIVGAGLQAASHWPLHDSAATRRLEAAAAAGLPAHTLMRRAGLATARLALALTPQARRIWIAAGAGNNGGDGLEAALRLHAAGKVVVVSLLAGAPRADDARAALERARSAGVTLLDADMPPLTLGPDDLAIDALLGLGATNAPRGTVAAAIDRLNQSAAPVLAIDLPSGLDADTGRTDGTALRARWTLALLALKPGLFTAQGRDHAGQTWFDPLGVDPAPEPATARLLTDAAALWPRRLHAQHKGSFGDLWVVGGAAGMAGAALLAARAGLAAGAGRVLAVLLDPAAATVDALHPELMHRPPAVLSDHDTALESATVVCGCGGGAAVAALLPVLLSRAGRLLLDADALNAIAADPALAALLPRRAARGRTTLLTPHPLEAARLLGSDATTVQRDRLAAARALAQRCSATVVLKGSGSVVATPDGDCVVNASGNAALATAGTGDVLAGWVGGLWSQGLAPAEAAALGVHSHGRAADRWLGSRGAAGPLPAGRLIELLQTG